MQLSLDCMKENNLYLLLHMTSGVAILIVTLFFLLVTLLDGLDRGFCLRGPKYPLLSTFDIVAIIKSIAVFFFELSIISNALFEFVGASFVSCITIVSIVIVNFIWPKR